MTLPTTMKAVVFDGLYKVSVQDRPVPQGMSSTLDVDARPDWRKESLAFYSNHSDLYIELGASLKLPT